jgi:hypothetical protein
MNNFEQKFSANVTAFIMLHTQQVMDGGRDIHYLILVMIANDVKALTNACAEIEERVLLDLFKIVVGKVIVDIIPK